MMTHQHLIVGAEAFERGLGCVQRGGVRSWDESSSADGCFGSRISFTIPALQETKSRSGGNITTWNLRV